MVCVLEQEAFTCSNPESSGSVQSTEKLLIGDLNRTAHLISDFYTYRFSVKCQIHLFPSIPGTGIWTANLNLFISFVSFCFI